MQHGEDARGAAGYERDTLFVLSDGLLPVAAGHVPEHNTGQFISARGKDAFGIFEVRCSGTFSAAVKLHIGDDIQRFRQFALRYLVFDRSGENKLKHFLDIRIGALVVLMAVTDFFQNVAALDLNKLRMLRERDEVIFECASIALGKVDTEGQCDSRGQRVASAVHGAGAVYDNKCIIIAGEVFLRVPGGVDAAALRLSDLIIEERSDDVIRCQRAGVEPCFAGGYLTHKRLISLAVVAEKRLAILEHCLGRLLLIVEGIVSLTQVVLDDTDVGTELYKRLAVGFLPHSKRRVDLQEMFRPSTQTSGGTRRSS